jgi:hypothetical protein
MDSPKQIALRNKLADLARQSVEAGDINLAIACWGAATVFLGCLPPNSRETACAYLDGQLLDHANKRARELRSGAFDDQAVAQ